MSASYKFLSKSSNDILNIFNCILRDSSIYSLEDFSNAFNSLTLSEKELTYKDVDFLNLNNTLLLTAIENQKTDLAYLLLELGFNPNTPNIRGFNPLLASIKYDLEALALDLIDLTHDLEFARMSNGKKNGDTALIWASNKGMINVVKKLVNKEVDLFYTNEFHQHALFYCTLKGEGDKTDKYLEVFEYLIPLYKEKAFIENISGVSMIENIFRFGRKEFFDIIAYTKLDFPNLTQNTIDRLKDKTPSTYSETNASNSFNTHQELVYYWDKLKDMIKIQNNIQSKIGTHSIKNKSHKI